jgi:hypothetical protein
VVLEPTPGQRLGATSVPDARIATTGQREHPLIRFSQIAIDRTDSQKCNRTTAKRVKHRNRDFWQKTGAGAPG